MCLNRPLGVHPLQAPSAMAELKTQQCASAMIPSGTAWLESTGHKLLIRLHLDRNAPAQLDFPT
jgi:hypothetical protein